jgi:hypothetical protein
MIFSATVSAQSGDFVVSSQEMSPVLLFQPGTSTILEHAVDDFVEDSLECTNKEYQVVDSASGELPVVILFAVIDQSPLLKDLEDRGLIDVSAVRDKWESFVIQPIRSPWPGTGKALVVAGSDERGAMYGLYEASERLFGTDPMKFWTGTKPEHKDYVVWDDGKITAGPPAFRYRGLFINDEDYLLAWKGDNPDDRVVEAEIYTEVFETICRLKGNMIAPAMYAVYMDPESRKLASDRGLYYTASHLEILLANPMIHWHGYSKEHFGEHLPYSFVRYPEELGHFWEDSIQRHQDYLNIWPLGLRGQDDRDFVHTDSAAPKTLEDRAALTADAIEFEQELLRKYFEPEDECLTTVTMRGEGLRQYKSGKMGVPDETILVWEDNGSRALLPNLPNEEEQKRPGGNGIYYHLTYCDHQWTQWVPLELIRDEFRKALDQNADKYVLFNVGDIREIPLTITGAMDLVWEADPWMQTADYPDIFLHRWAENHFGREKTAEIADIYNKYYELEYWCRGTSVVEMVAPFTLSEEVYPVWTNDSLLKTLDDTDKDLVDFLLEYSGKVDIAKKYSSRYNKCKPEKWLENSPQWDELYKKAKEVYSALQPEYRQFFFENMILQIQTSRMINHWAIAVMNAFDACEEGKFEQAGELFQKASDCMYTVVSEREKASQGKWENWFRGEYHSGWEKSIWGFKPLAHAQDAEKLSQLMLKAKEEVGE